MPKNAFLSLKILEKIEELGDLIRKLGTIRYNFYRLVPVDYPNLAGMLDSLGKQKRHSLAQASLNTRLLPADEKLSNLMQSIRVLFEMNEEYDFSFLDGILETVPETGWRAENTFFFFLQKKR